MLKTVLIALLVSCTAVNYAQETGKPQSQNTSTPRLIRVSGGVMIGLLAHAPMPQFPDEALRNRIQGDVIFKVSIDEGGKIVLAEPVQGNPLLAAACMDSLRAFRFQPYYLNGNPIRVESQLGFDFKVSGEGDKARGQVELMSNIPYRPEFRTGVLTAENALVLWPRKVSGGDPQLPAELAGKAGSVYLHVTIGIDGRVEDVKIVGGDKPFIQPVVDAVRQFVYEPQLVNGKPTVATVSAAYHFGKLQ